MLQATDPPAPNQSVNQHRPDLSHVPPEYRAKLTDLLDRFSSIFAQQLPPGLPHNITPCEVIPTEPGVKPPYRAPYRLSPLERKHIEEAVKDLLAKGHIEPSTSPYGCPTLFVAKPNQPGELRQVFDYRALNAITKRNRFPLPRIDTLLDTLKGSTIFSNFDLTAGYNQLRLWDSDVPKTAFSCPQGHFHWRVLSMGLTNAPSVFQMSMQQIFAKQLNRNILCFLDDVCCFSKSIPEHLIHLEETMQTMQDNHLICKLSKCSFFQTQLRYLGHIISAEGIQSDPRKLEALRDWPFPTSVKRMQQFLGLANYFRKAAPDYSRVVAPLHDLVKKGVNYAEQAAHPIYLHTFNRVKQLMTEQPILAFPDPDLPYELVSDASMTGCGAVLLQNDHPVAYYSNKFNPAEQNYTTGEQELLGVVKALKEWRCYLEGCTKLTVTTDHNPLIYLPTQSMLSRRQSRWLEFLSRFVIQWQHTKGVNNPADGLSRIHMAEPAISFLRLCAITSVLDLNQDFISLFPAAYNEDTRFQDPSFTRTMTLHQGFWYQQGTNRIVVPQAAQHAVLQAHHSTAFSGHFGTRRTTEHVSRRFCWPGMHAQIKAFCASCPECQQNKASTQLPYGLLQPLQIPDDRWDVVCLDFVTGLPRTARQHDAILVFVDKLTKMVHLAPTKKTCTAKEAARLFLSHVWSQHGSPVKLVSDRDKLFTSEFWGQFCHHLGIKQAMSTAFHPETDAQTERSNRTIEEVLRHFTSNSNKSWDDLLPYVEFAMNNAKNASTNETPFYLNSGKHPRTPITNQLPPKPPGAQLLPSIETIFADRDEVLLRIRRLLQAAQDRQKHYADSSRRPHAFAAGQQVLLSTVNFRFQGKGRKKLYPKFVGPFTISSMVGPNAAQLDLPAGWDIHNVFHVSLLRPYVARDGAMLVPPPPTLDGTPIYQVETILGHKDVKTRGQTTRQYLIRWAGYTQEHDSWEIGPNLSPQLIEAYSRSALGQRGGNVGHQTSPYMTRSRTHAITP